MIEWPSFVCPICGAKSYHPKDIEHGYCGRCHAFTAAEPQMFDGERGTYGDWKCYACKPDQIREDMETK
jgi:hypothetical protein